MLGDVLQDGTVEGVDAAVDDACLDDATVLALLEGRLTADELGRADEHVDRCALCSSLVVGVARGGAAGRVPREGARVGRYIIVDEIGRGGFGVVLRAYDPELDRRVALKLLLVPGDRAWSPGLGGEARAMAKLNHPHVVTVYEVGRHGDAVFIAMELVEGQSVRDWLVEERPVDAVVDVFVQAGEGLAAAHAAGLVHGDFKPDNVLIGRDGRVRVTDFGLATSDDWGRGDAELDRWGALPLARSATVTGRLIGTPAYMAPEQLAGGAADAVSDQHAFCVSFYEAVAGRRPFEAESLAQLVEEAPGRSVPDRTAPELAAIPKPVLDVLERGLAVDPSERFAHMPALLSALGEDLGGRRRRRWVVGTIAAVAAVALGVAIAAQPEPCSGGRALAEETWNPERRRDLLDAFDRAAPGSGPGADRTVAAAVQDWQSRWLASYQGICLAARDAPSAADDARRACLQRQRLEVDALLSAFQQPSREAVARAPDVFAELPDPARCETAASSAPTPTQADVLERLEPALADAKAELAVGRFESARDLAADLVRQGARVGYDPALAEAQLLLGETQRQLGLYDAAEASTLEALWAARRASDDRLAALAWLQRAAIAGTREQLDRSEEAIGHAGALMPRLADPRLVARLHNARGVLLTHLRRFDEAEDDLTRGLEIRRRRLGERHVEVGRSLTSLGNLARKRGDLERARRHHEAARAIDLELLGPEHPNQARHLHNLARITLLEGEAGEARALYERALSLRRDALGDAHPDVGITYNSLGLLHARRGELEEARRAFGHAIARLSPTRPVAAARAAANLAALDERPDDRDEEPATMAGVGAGEPPRPKPAAPRPAPPSPSPMPSPPSEPAPRPSPPSAPTPAPRPPGPSSYMPGEAWD